MRIPYTKPSITEVEINRVTEAATKGWGARCYECIEEFESNFALYIDMKYAIATSSCTGAMTLGLATLGIGPGDEVILADTNWIAVAAPIFHAGAKPVFVDIESDSWCISVEKVRLAITPRTKAIVAVHLYGNACDIEKLIEISEEFNIPIIEDAAEGLGTKINSKRAGSFGIFSTFSFHGTKTLTTGEGGMLLTNNEEIYNKALMLSNHGRNPDQENQFWAEEAGFKFKMSNIQAALGCAQLLRVNELTLRKQEILKKYKQKILDLPGVRMNPDKSLVENGAWMPTVVFDKETKVTRQHLIQAFRERDIDARVFFWPLSSLPIFDAVKENVNAWDLPGRAINLPSFHDITDEQISKVADVIASFAS